MINKINSKNLIIGTANFSSNYGLKHKNKAIKKKKKKISEKYVEKLINKSLKNLKVKTLYALLFHNPK